MKKTILILILAAIGTFGVVTYAHGGRYNLNRQNRYVTENKELDAEISRLKDKYNVEESKNLNPSKLTDKELDHIGEILMEIMIPDKREHEYMDQMMGGEGSDSLTAMHQHMAYNYLNGYGFGMMGNFGGGMMHGRRGHGFGMMGNWDRDDFQESHLDILKKRLANGEITKQEYLEMKEILAK